MNFVDGIPSGEYRYWYENGNCGIQGTFVTWYDNGKLHEKGKCKNGQPVGKWTIKSEDGKVIYNHAPVNVEIVEGITGNHNLCDYSSLLEKM